jgi:chromate reductase
VNHPADGAAQVVLISGSTRPGSTNTATLRTAAGLEVPGVTAVLWERLVDVPAFVPDDDADPPPVVVELRALLASADAVVLCTPEYAGSLPGSLKNVLDWLVGSGELYGKPVAWITVAHPGRGEGARATLATVLGYEGAEIVERACVRIPVGRDLVDPDGTIHDLETRTLLAAQLTAVAEHLRGGGDDGTDQPKVS